MRFKGAEPLIANRLHIYVFHWGRFSLQHDYPCSVTAGVFDQHLSNAWLADPDSASTHLASVWAYRCNIDFPESECEVRIFNAPEEPPSMIIV